jgi:surfeit locus 1 family protein
VLSFCGIAALSSLGVWQLHRRTWKLNLIEQVGRQAHAPAADAPGPRAWHSLTAADAYRHVRVRGVFLNDRETLVQASTAFGPGYWVVTPLRTADGFVVLVNRGFVPPEKRAAASRAEGAISGETTVTGLLRLTEPKGRFLRANDPAAGRWYSRDVAAIARADGLAQAAPYFVDADGTPNAGGFPVGGLTVIAFPNNHLVYAFTWFGLALLLAGTAAAAMRAECRAGGREA